VAVTPTAPRGETISQGSARSTKTSRGKREETPGRTAVSQETSHMTRGIKLWGTGQRGSGLRAGEPAPEVRERRAREGASIAGHGRPLERRSPGEHRRRSQNNIGDGLNGLTGGARPWRRPSGEGVVARGLPWRAALEPGGNVRRGAGVERRNGRTSREGSGGQNPRSVSGMKQGRDGQGGRNALRG
jgi:hypothetical protein